LIKQKLIIYNIFCSELIMVKLGFTLQTKGSIDKVFGYFSHFEKIS
jgi:hypothetical protein